MKIEDAQTTCLFQGFVIDLVSNFDSIGVFIVTRLRDRPTTYMIASLFFHTFIMVLTFHTVSTRLTVLYLNTATYITAQNVQIIRYGRPT